MVAYLWIDSRVACRSSVRVSGRLLDPALDFASLSDLGVEGCCVDDDVAVLLRPLYVIGCSGGSSTPPRDRRIIVSNVWISTFDPCVIIVGLSKKSALFPALLLYSLFCRSSSFSGMEGSDGRKCSFERDFCFFSILLLVLNFDANEKTKSSCS